MSPPVTPAVDKIMRDLEKLIRFEPTCIKCGCTETNACPEGCSWVFINKQYEGLCSVCLDAIVRPFRQLRLDKARRK